jgi:glycosyltransferase involved in cell wall biosynthesis
MTISIVTATFNHESTLPFLWESMQSQKPHEWLICDDGSIDGTLDLIKEYSTKDWVQGFWQSNKGMRLAMNLNNGLRRATGDLIFIVMGDSYLQENTLQTLKKTYVPGSAGCGYRENVNPDGSFHSQDWRGGCDICLRKTNPGALTGNSMIVLKKDLESIGYWDERFVGYGKDDWDVFAKIMKMGIPCYHYGDVKINHFYHGGQEDNPENTKLFNKLHGG